MSPPVGFGRKCPRFLAYKVRHWISFCVVSGYCIRCTYNIGTVMTSWCLLVGWLAAGGGGGVDWLVGDGEVLIGWKVIVVVCCLMMMVAVILVGDAWKMW